MTALRYLREQIAEAELLHGGRHESDAPESVRAIIANTRAVCPDPATVGAYLSRASSLLTSFSHVVPSSREALMLRAFSGPLGFCDQYRSYGELQRRRGPW